MQIVLEPSPYDDDDFLLGVTHVAINADSRMMNQNDTIVPIIWFFKIQMETDTFTKLNCAFESHSYIQYTTGSCGWCSKIHGPDLFSVWKYTGAGQHDNWTIAKGDCTEAKL
jgi:hypothetical protein